MTVSEPIREEDDGFELLEPRLVKCMRCSGTGRPGPKRRGAAQGVCPACDGDGKVLETHEWAGYEATLDFCQGAFDCCRGAA